ncbi:MAG: hypothetical protein IAE82_01250 [Opitutaceae bacterium]|nr:hypothetical protein [Opitutaceae bacterium]
MKLSVSPASVRVLSAGLLAALVAGLSGCASQVYNVKVDAIQNPEVVPGYSYRITAKEAVRGMSDPRQTEAVALVKTALAGRGMYEAPDPAQAEVEIVINYGVGPQRLRIEPYDPGWEPSMARAPLAIIPVRKADGTVSYAAVPAEQLDVDGTLNGLPVLRGSHVFEKYLSITARETPVAVHGGRKPAEVWQVQVSVEDMKDSLEGYLPVLAGAAADYLGTSTGKSERVRLRDSDEIVAFVKGGH